MAELYECDYVKPSGYIKLYKYDVPLPKEPPITEFVNYGLPIEQQKFRRTNIPKSLYNRKKSLTTEEQRFIDEEWHKRKNGVWILIKGIKVYLTGPYYTYLNYWWTLKGILPEFRYIQCLIFLFWDMVKRDINSYGMFLVKPRRIGGTEITLFMVWEYITRVRHTKGGMQSKDEKTIIKNFKRLTRGNKRVIWFMKPIQKGSDDPDEILEFRYPRSLNTEKSLRELAETGEEKELVYSEEEMDSEVDYRACDPLAYDNEELNIGVLNEAGKLEGMSLADWWDKQKPCYHYFDGAEIVGKNISESSIEEIDDQQIAEVYQMCKDSMPDNRDENGRTISGLHLLFINYLDAAKPDEWGFPMKEQSKIFHDNKIAALKKAKRFKDVTNLLRKEPETLEDAITPSGNQSAFNREALQDIDKRLKFPEDFGGKEQGFGMYGNFTWANGTPDTTVVFIPGNAEDSKFYVSELLNEGEACANIYWGGIRYPKNVRKFRGGVDPYEHDEVVDIARASKGAGVIGRMYDDLKDGGKKTDVGSPIDRGWEWETYRPVCDYLAREEDPDVFFEDMLMMHFYYGTQMLVENNKVSIKKYFRRRGYGQYLMERPESTMDPNSRSYSVNQVGAPATTDTIQQYFNAIAHYVYILACAIKHPRIVGQLLEMNKANRGKMDLGVAFGWMLIAFEKEYLQTPGEGITNDEADQEQWFEYYEV